MMKRWIPYLLTLLLFSSLLSCEKEYVVLKSIENQTEYDITILLHHDSYAVKQDTIYIPAGETVTISSRSYESQEVLPSHPLGNIDSVEYITPKDVYLNTDLTNCNMWTHHTEKKSRFSGNVQESYHFTIKAEHMWKVTRQNG
ncbi:MAG: hypothetical protein PF448_09745 [Bacteroidales bacterium]|jgi:hypothetical protein|nr:hypothetical protein [Bacteroidales bacterium]